jgi:DNA-binding protein H-NS
MAKGSSTAKGSSGSKESGSSTVSGVDLSKFSIEELEVLAKGIEAEIVQRRESERERVLNQMRELAASLGMTLEDVVRQEKGPVPPKYRHPDNPAFTWTGRGKRPNWVTQALASGKTLEDLAV